MLDGLRIPLAMSAMTHGTLGTRRLSITTGLCCASTWIASCDTRESVSRTPSTLASPRSIQSRCSRASPGACDNTTAKPHARAAS